jgi:hypothetical protein
LRRLLSAPGDGVYTASDLSFLDDLEKREVNFFYNETNPNTGLVPDSSNANGGGASAFSSIAAIGFGLTALTIGDARGWLAPGTAYQRALTTVNFLYSDTAASVNGFFYHFLDPNTGARFGNTELSSIDTAELMAGVISVGQYWPNTPLAQTATNLFNRVNWPWMQQPSGVFYGAWTPESGYSGGYGDFSEAALLYLLALGSPTHPASRASWNSWSRSPSRSYAGYTYITADDNALFTVQYPMAWFDLRGLTDSAGLNYYTNAQNATLAQRQWMADLHTTYSQWGLNMWGLTPSDSQHGYAVWGGPPAYGPIDGTVVPTGPGGSLEFTPRQSVDALKNMSTALSGLTYRAYGLIDSFNPQTAWRSNLVLGIDIGMTLLSAENSRNNFVWNLFNSSPVARQSLASAFTQIAPSLQSASSRKIRSSDSQVMDVPLNLSGAPTVDGRVGGPTQIVLNFEANIVKGATFSISLSSGSVSSSIVSGNSLIINLSGAPDGQTLTVNVNDVRHFSNTASGGASFSIGVLLADANSDGHVDLTDFTYLASNFNKTGGAMLIDGDFNVDGNVDLTDFTYLASQFNKSLAAAPAAASAVVTKPRMLAPILDDRNTATDLIDAPTRE